MRLSIGYYINMSSDATKNVPSTRKKRTQPKRKAPSAPSKKKTSHDQNSKSHDYDDKSMLSNLKQSGKDGGKSLKRSVSPRKEQYTSLLDEVAGRGDMVLLDPITEDNVVNNLKKRYEAGEIYVRNISCKHVSCIHQCYSVNEIWGVKSEHTVHHLTTLVYDNHFQPCTFTQFLLV